MAPSGRASWRAGRWRRLRTSWALSGAPNPHACRTARGRGSIEPSRRTNVNGKRRSYETGHRPKFMVVVDETPECGRAIHFAARRVARTGADLLMLSVVTPPDNFEWIGVGEAMREEAEAEARERL